jgi:hypothetical protein
MSSDAPGLRTAAETLLGQLTAGLAGDPGLLALTGPALVVSAAMRRLRPGPPLWTPEQVRAGLLAVLRLDLDTDQLERIALDGPVCDPQILAAVTAHPRATGRIVLEAGFTAHSQLRHMRQSLPGITDAAEVSSAGQVDEVLTERGEFGRFAVALAGRFRLYRDFARLSDRVTAAGPGAAAVAVALIGDLQPAGPWTLDPDPAAVEQACDAAAALIGTGR